MLQTIAPAILLGFASLCLFMGYYVHMLITETIIESVSSKTHLIDASAGYIGQSIQYAAFAISCLISPLIVSKLSSRRALFLCGVLFCLFFLGFIRINKIYFYLSQIFIGLGYAVFNNAEGDYLCHAVPSDNLELAMSVETAINHGGQFVSGIVLFTVIHIPHLADVNDPRSYSDLQIKFLYLVFSCFGLISLLIISILPKCNVEREKRNVVTQMVTTMRCMIHPKVLMFLPFNFYQGFFTAFFLGVYPTSFSFNEALGGDKNLIAFYCFFIGIGVISGGLIVSIFAKRFPSFALIPSMVIHVIFGIGLYVIVTITTPPNGFAEKTAAPAIIEPAIYIVCTAGFLVGFCDVCITTTRGVISQRLIPDRRMEVFSATKLFQAGSSAITPLLTYFLLTMHWGILLISLLFTGFLSCVYVCSVLDPRKSYTVWDSTSP